MRNLTIKLMVVSISIICFLNLGFVSALEPNEASVSLLWSTPKVYQGDIVSVRITFTSSTADQLTIVGIGLQFDWDPDKFYGPDLSANPVTVSGFGTHIFDAIAIQIPAHVSTGTHSYFVGVDGVQGYSLDFSWDSPGSTIQVQSATGKVYGVLLSQFEIDLSEARDANFKSAEARSLLQQAQAEYDISRSLVNSSFVSDENWSQALLHIQNATTYLEQANAAEQRTDEQAGEQQTLLFYIAIAAIAVIIALSIIVIVRKRRRQPEPVEEQPVNQSFDEQPETQDYTPEE